MAKWYDNPVGREEVGEHRDQLPNLAKGRAAGLNPGNRHESTRLYLDGDQLDTDIAQRGDGPSQVATKVYTDHARSLINRVDSPDLHFNWTMNPYRGCEHGCVYCYARPDHERLGFSLGLDFETRIMVKHNAPQLLRKELGHPDWKGESIMLAGDTDCYQPLEAKLAVTRRCLEVLVEARQPVSIVTKNRLVTRDVDLLKQLATFNAVHVAVSITTLDNRLAAAMEPRASAPRERLEAIETLRASGVPVMVMVAPIIPALTDCEMPAILEAAANAGAMGAGYVLVRLPYQLKDLFHEWLHRHVPDRAAHVESLLRQMHGGKLYDSDFGVRERGTGPFAEHIAQSFKLHKRRLGLTGRMTPTSNEHFRRPTDTSGQGWLFDM